MHNRNYSKSLRIALIAVIVALALVAAAWVFLRNQARLELPAPPARAAPLAPLDLPPSTFAIPVAVSLDAIRGGLNQAVQQTVSGEQEAALGSRLRWSVTRSPIGVAARNGALRIGGNLEGDLRIETLAGSATVDLRGRYHIDSRPAMQPNWRLNPNLTMDFSLDQARHRLFGRFDISLRGTVGAQLEHMLRAQLDRLQRHVANDGSIEQVVRALWARLCSSVPIAASPGIWLEIRPAGLGAGQIRIDSEAISLHMALRARALIGTRETQPRCAFPERLDIGGAGPAAGAIELWLPVEAGYRQLQQALNRSVAGFSFDDAQSLTIEAARLAPFGRALLIEADFRTRTPSWLAGRRRISAYLVAEPVLDPEAATISLANVALDTAASHPAAAVAGEIAERRLLAVLEGAGAIELAEWQELLLRQANEALAGLLSESPALEDVAIAAQLDGLRLVRLDVGPDRMRAVAHATGTARVTIEKLALTAPE